MGNRRSFFLLFAGLCLSLFGLSQLPYTQVFPQKPPVQTRKEDRGPDQVQNKIFRPSSLLNKTPKFTDVTQQYGVKGYPYFGGHGVGWVDVNDDGRLDIYVKNAAAQGISDVKDILFINYGNHFVDEAEQRGVSDGYPIGTHGAVFTDLDGDRDFDLFSTTTYIEISPVYNHLYLNVGSGYFRDITGRITPFPKKNTSSRGVGAADFEGDGDIDLYFSNPLSDPKPFHPEPSPPQSLKNFFINSGDNLYTPAYRGIDWTGFVQGVTALDIDGDGDIDIAEAKWGPPSTIYLNDGKGYFYDAGEEMGLSQAYDVRDNGMSFGDIDGDGDLDLAVIGDRRIVIYNYREGNFEMSQEMETFWPHLGYHCCFGDFDNDGDLDLYESGGYLYENDGDGFFSLSSSQAISNAASKRSDPRGSALGDFDNDGDLDIYITDKRNYNVLLRNDIDNSDWIKAEIKWDECGGRNGVGTELDLYRAGHVNQPQYLVGHRQIKGEYGYLGQDMPAAHFGTPSAAKYDLKITFLDGTEKIYRNITAGEKINVYYPYVMIIRSESGGTTEPPPGVYHYDKGTEVTVKAFPDEHYIFDGWSGDINTEENPVTFTVNEDKSIKANFKMISPPSNIKGEKVLNRSLSQIEYINVLEWEVNPKNEGINIANYRLYQVKDNSWDLLEELPADTFKYWHRKVEKDKKQEYALTSVTEEGREGAAAYITIN